jgi:subtilisin family serine protease
MLKNHSFTIAVLSMLWSIGLSAQSKLDDNLANKLSTMQATDKIKVIVMLADQVDLSAKEADFTARGLSKAQRNAELLAELQQKSTSTQSTIYQAIENQSAPENLSWQSFWIINAISGEFSKAFVLSLAQMSDVGRIYEDGMLELIAPLSSSASSSVPNGSEPGLRAIGAQRLWAMGFTGQGTVVMNIDSGVDGTHPALSNSWRGNVPGVQASWAWFDQRRNSSPTPVDGDISGNGHGTHVMGTICGLDAATNDTIGVAFGAKWIAAPTIDVGFFNNHTSYTLNAFQWAANPDGNPNTADDVPDVIANSYKDPSVFSSECDSTGGGYWTAIRALETMGTAVIFAAGNNGVITSPGSNPNIFTVGAVNANFPPPYPIMSGSGRGPSRCNPVITKPEICAPGVSVRSAVPNNNYRFLMGTSMACPHIAGAIALLKSAFPNLTAVQIRSAIMQTATPYGNPVPNNTFGAGFVNVWVAYQYLNRQVTLDQKYSYGSRVAGSTLGRWTGSAFTSVTLGQAIQTSIGNTEILKGDQNLFSNEKYNTWVDNNQNREPDVSNHHFFLIQPNTTSLTSQFVQTEEQVLVKSELIDAPNFAWGTIGFKDPWLIDFNDAPYGLRNRGMAAPFYDRASPFTPDLTTAYPVQSGSATYKGVFLNQDPLNNPTYYSVRAQSTQTIGGYTGDFLGWAGVGATPSSPANLETPVVFTAPNAMVSARYKGRLLSSEADATGNSGQRRLAKDHASPNIYHLVYESAGKIWYAYSMDNGATFTKEQFVGSGHSPSISAGQLGAMIAYNNYGSIVVRYANIDYQTYTSFALTSDIETVGREANINAKPCALVTDWHGYGLRDGLIAFESYDEIDDTKLIVARRRPYYNHPNWTTLIHVPDSQVQQGNLEMNPAFGHFYVQTRKADDTMKTYVVWNSSGSSSLAEGCDPIRIAVIHHYIQSPSVSISNPIALPIDLTYNHVYFEKPTISVDQNDNKRIAWEAFNHTIGRKTIFTVFLSGGNSSSIATVFSDVHADLSRPSLNWANNSTSMLFQSGNGFHRATSVSGSYYSGPGWGSITQYHGNAAGIVASGSKRYAFTTGTTAPYQIQLGEVGAGRGGGSQQSVVSGGGKGNSPSLC